MLIRSRGEKTFEVFNIFIMILLGMVTLFPLIHIASKSLSDEAYVLARDIVLFPKGLQFEAYRNIIGNARFARSFQNTIILTFVGTSINVMMTVITAYPLSRKRFPGQSAIMVFYVFTMFFSGGIIPSYLLMRDLKLLDSMWSLILPGTINVYNMILIKNFFMSVPDSLEESAKIDGCKQIRILFSIFFPLSLPAISTITLFYAVGHWNSYFAALMYLNSRNKYPLQLFLREMLIEETVDVVDISNLLDVAPDSVKAATIIVATVPILVIYPFLQKYFVKGVMIGAIKE
ncbi:MAG TPA: carbohydrate ABC transporter permease [Clostridiales bacterium]|nr:carbohydrate ABC transporter permease [Clostridiales bacterium]